MSEVQPYRRRWFQFGLLGFLLTLAMLGAFLGLITRERSYIRERQRLLKSATNVVPLSEMDWADYSELLQGEPPPAIPRFRMWLGDEAVLIVQFTGQPQAPEQERIKGYFPEAKLITFLPPMRPARYRGICPASPSPPITEPPTTPIAP